VVDLKLQLDVAKLQALGNALDKVDAAIKALPTPSAVRVLGTRGAGAEHVFKGGVMWRTRLVAEGHVPFS
jgi:hypothetical protein